MQSRGEEVSGGLSFAVYGIFKNWFHKKLSGLAGIKCFPTSSLVMIRLREARRGCWMCSGGVGGKWDLARRLRLAVDGVGARGETQGWTAGVSRRLLQKLLSLVIPNGYYLFGGTLTLRQSVEPKVFQQLRVHHMLMFARKLGLRADEIHSAWVKELQTRGALHSHTLTAVPASVCWRGRRLLFVADIQAAFVGAWMEVCENAGYTALPVALDFRLLSSEGGKSDGWLNYLCKHMARGESAQRKSGAELEGKSSGRMWGFSRGWEFQPIRDTRLLSQSLGFAMRRQMRRFLRARNRDLFLRARDYFLRNSGDAMAAFRFRSRRRALLMSLRGHVRAAWDLYRRQGGGGGSGGLWRLMNSSRRAGCTVSWVSSGFSAALRDCGSFGLDGIWFQRPGKPLVAGLRLMEARAAAARA